MTSLRTTAFVHIEDKTAAEDAIRNLHHYKLHGRVNINVEASKNKSETSTKLHVWQYQPYLYQQKSSGPSLRSTVPVIECDIVKDYAFVHMERAERMQWRPSGALTTQSFKVNHPLGKRAEHKLCVRE